MTAAPVLGACPHASDAVLGWELHHDAFTLGPRHGGIYWLRLCRLENNRFCGVVREASGNNSQLGPPIDHLRCRSSDPWRQPHPAAVWASHAYRYPWSPRSGYGRVSPLRLEARCPELTTGSRMSAAGHGIAFSAGAPCARLDETCDRHCVSRADAPKTR